MRLLAIPEQSPIHRAFPELEKDRLKAGSFYSRLVDVMEELMTFTWLTRDRNDMLVDRCSERVESAEALPKRVNGADRLA